MMAFSLRVVLYSRFISLFYSSKCDVAFKIITRLKFNNVSYQIQ
jgi:hypothetical protein